MIYYFSGTGNSHYVAEVLSKSLQDTMQSIESAQGIKKDEMIGIVTPVYFFGLPETLLCLIFNQWKSQSFTAFNKFLCH